MNFKRILFIITASATAALLNAQNIQNQSNNESRLVAASEILKPGANEIAIFTRGAICGSCGVGIRIQLSKLDGVDKKKYKKGILLDAENQLTVLAFEEGVEPDLNKIFQAIYDAGYDPMNYYQHTGQTVELIDYTFTEK
ncbi:MAG: hypothetical protein AAF065_06485 [Verrucomicrobiota bacterium]